MSSARSKARAFAILLTAVAALAFAPPSSGAPTAPLRVTTLGPGVDPRLAVNAAGAAVVVWYRREGRAVRAALRPDGARAWAASTVSVGPASESTQRVALGAAGDILVAWRADITFPQLAPPGVDVGNAPAGVAVQARFRPAGAPAWGPPEPVSPPRAGAARIEIALGPSGSALASWLANDFASVIASRGPASWTATPFGDSRPERLQLAITPPGAAVALWEVTAASNSIVYAAVRPTGTDRFGPPVVLSRGGSQRGLSPPRLATGADGTVVAVWVRRRLGGRQRVEAATLAPGAISFGPVQTVSGPQGNGLAPDVAVDEHGGAVVTWQEGSASGSAIQVSRRPSGATDWRAPQTLTTPSPRNFGPRVAVAGGQAAVVWTRAARAGLAVQVARLAPGAARFRAPSWLFQPTRRGDTARRAQVGVDGRGRVVVTWERSNFLNHPTVQAIDLAPLGAQ